MDRIVRINVTKNERNVTLNVVNNVIKIIVSQNSSGGGGGGITTLTSSGGTITITGSPTAKNLELSSSLVSLINSALQDAPNNANAYVRSGLSWVIGYTKSAIDTLLGGKANTPTGTPDGTKYLRDDNTWQFLIDATASVKGIAKLYTSLGSNTDGAVDQNTVNTAINNILPDLVFTDTVDGFEIGTVDDTVEFKGSGTIEFGGAVELLAPAVGGTIATEEWVNESNQRIYLKPTATFPYLHTITTGATEEIVLEIPIAGSLLQNGSYLRAWTQNNFSTSAAGNKTLRYRISATSGTLGSLIGNRLTTSTSVNGLPLNRHFDFINDKLVVSQNGATSALSNISETTGSKTEVAYTYATTYYLQLTVQMPTAGESIDIYSFFVEGHK